MTACTLFTPDPTEYRTQHELQIDNITLPMNINPKILGLTLDHKLTYNKHIETTTTKARNIQSHKKTHTRVGFHHMVTTSIKHKHQQTTDNTKHRTQNCNWVYNRHKDTTYTRRNTHYTDRRTPQITRSTEKTKITSTHNTTTQQT